MQHSRYEVKEGGMEREGKKFVPKIKTRRKRRTRRKSFCAKGKSNHPNRSNHVIINCISSGVCKNKKSTQMALFLLYSTHFCIFFTLLYMERGKSGQIEKGDWKEYEEK
jgi:hypothetical protein